MSRPSVESEKLMEVVLRDRPTYTGRTVLSRQLIAEEDPQFLQHFHWMHMHMLHERTSLPGKIKELCICAIDAATGYSRGLYTHFRGAVAQGATRDDLFAGMHAAYIPGGIHILTISLPVLGEVFKETETGIPSKLAEGVDHQLSMAEDDPVLEMFHQFLLSDYSFPEKYEHIIKAAVMMVNEKYDLLDEETGLALQSGASIGEVFEGLCSSSHGWRILH